MPEYNENERFVSQQYLLFEGENGRTDLHKIKLPPSIRSIKC